MTYTFRFSVSRVVLPQHRQTVITSKHAATCKVAQSFLRSKKILNCVLETKQSDILRTFKSIQRGY